MPINVEEFFADPNVVDMTGEQRAMWLLVIVESWRRKTLLPADDAKIARLLGINPKRWRAHYKPVFAAMMSVKKLENNRGIIGEFSQIQKVSAVWDEVAVRISKNKLFAANARAAKAAKHGKEPSVAEPKIASVTEPVTEPAPGPDPALHQNQDKKGGPQPSKRPAASPFLESLNNGFSFDLDAEPASDPALRHRLVSDGLRSAKKPASGGSLFGALQAAIRDDDDEE